MIELELYTRTFHDDYTVAVIHQFESNHHCFCDLLDISVNDLYATLHIISAY